MNEKEAGTPAAETQALSLDDKLALVKRKVHKISHIEVDQDLFKDDPEKRPILFICPARVYEENPETGECIVNFENCLECGSCQVVSRGYVKWKNPQGGFGASYSFG